MRSSVYIWLLAAAAGLLAAPPALQAQVGFVGVWERAEPMIAQASQQTGLPVAIFQPAELDGQNPERARAADECAVLFVLNLDPAQAVSMARRLENSSRRRKIIALDIRGSHAELQKAGLLVSDPEIPKYWRANGLENIRRLLVYTSVKYLGGHGQIQPPVLIPDFGYYDPDREEPFADLPSYISFRTARHRWRQGAPVAALLIQQSFWVTHDTKVIDAQVRALEKQGVNPVVIFGDREAMVVQLIRDAKPDILVEDRHGAMWESRNLLETLDVPYLRPISMLGYTLEEWRKDPRGLSTRDVGMFMTVQESWGTIEPVLVGGLKVNISGFRLHEPLDSGVEMFAERTASWLRLRAKASAEKRIALIYYNKGLGKDDLMRGSPTGAFLDGPESMVRFLPQMQQHGYRLDKLPRTSDELVGWMRDRGRNIGPWNQGELEELVNRGHPALVPLSRYRKWFESKLSPARRAAVVKAFGPPPGKMMVVERGGEPQIVVPRIQLGNVLLLPQPERGQSQDEKLLHSRDIPPPHNYLAFYWWLQEEFHADAMVHWGTHGSLELLPGKEAGLAADDWTSVCTGPTPVVDLWITDNLGEATLSRRRSNALLVDHLPPPAVQSASNDRYRDLISDLDKYFALDVGLLKEEYRKRISQAVRQQHVLDSLKLHSAGESLTDAEIRQAADFVREVTEARTPLTLHILGEPPEKQYLADYMVSILGRKFLDHVAATHGGPDAAAKEPSAALRDRARALVRSSLLSDEKPPFAVTPELAKDLEFGREMLKRLNRSGEEISGLLRALDGRYVVPGPGPDPIRNPDSAPGGRNLYALNPEEIPTRAAWEVGVRLVDELLARKHPAKIAVDLSGMDTMRDFGVMEAQILYLIGTRPVWDRNNLAIDVELIPSAELKRPRIDVFCAMGGQYKENFGSRVKLLDKAFRLISALEEKDNYVRRGTERVLAELKKQGFKDEESRMLAPARIFGTKPGNMSGTNILYLIPRSGVWEKDNEVADVYVDNMSYAYTGEVWGEKIGSLYQDAIQGTDTVLRVWASNMTSQLSNHHAYEYLGGLSMAVQKLTGKQPEALIADVRDPAGARMRDFNEVLATNMQSELLNREWVEGMKSHGYAGAGHAAELVKNTFGWSVTRTGSVSDAQWAEIYAVYMDDKYHVGIREWMRKTNPHALQEMAATMLEAARKEYWRASPATVAQLARAYAELAVEFGDSGGLVSGGNHNLETFVTKALKATGAAPAAQLAAKMSDVLARAAHPAPGAPAMAKPISPAAGTPAPQAARAATVTGQRLVLVGKQKPAAARNAPDFAFLVAAMISFALMAGGFFFRRGVI